MNRLLTVAWVILLLMSHSARAEKTLAWNALKVQAHLDGEGRLHIVERHDMLFTGAWNGGWRTFRNDRSQELVVESVTRIDAAGKPHLLANVIADAPSRWAKGKSGKIHYKSWGRGDEALVLIHGWSCDMNYFAEQVPHFSDRMRVITIDLPGHGKSAAPEIEYTQALFADSIRLVLDKARVRRAVLVGHSMGMPVARQFYRMYPKRTAGIISLDGSVKAMITDPKVIEGFLANLRGPGYKAAATRMIDGMLAAAPDSRYKKEIRETMLSTPQHVVAGAAKGMFDLTLWNDDPINVPTLLINAPSPMWSAEYEQYARQLIPNIEYVTVPGVSHFLHTEKPAEVNAIIDAFLKKNSLLEPRNRT